MTGQTQILLAFAPNGQRITHEYWLEPQTAPVTFWTGAVDPDEAEDHHQIGPVTALMSEADDVSDVEHQRDGDRVLRWMAADQTLWADEDLIFRTMDGQRVPTDQPAELAAQLLAQASGHP